MSKQELCNRLFLLGFKCTYCLDHNMEIYAQDHIRAIFYKKYLRVFFPGEKTTGINIYPRQAERFNINSAALSDAHAFILKKLEEGK